MNFAHCKRCGYYESDGDEPLHCDCPRPKREKHWIDRCIERVREIEKEEE